MVQHQSSKRKFAPILRPEVEEVGFQFNPGGRGRVYNTFNAHRLLHWAGVKGPDGSQHALKRALLEAYQGRAERVESDEVLLAVVASVGLDVAEAQGHFSF
jgi:predicted DsbA family dithiol-disulfide isomerase